MFNQCFANNVPYTIMQLLSLSSSLVVILEEKTQGCYDEVRCPEHFDAKNTIIHQSHAHILLEEPQPTATKLFNNDDNNNNK